jgi:hypothetical protein
MHLNRGLRYGVLSIAEGKEVTQAEFQWVVKMWPSAHFIREVCPLPIMFSSFCRGEQRLLVLFLNKDGFLLSSLTLTTVPLPWVWGCGLNLQVSGLLNISKYESNKFLVLCDDFPVQKELSLMFRCFDLNHNQVLGVGFFPTDLCRSTFGGLFMLHFWSSHVKAHQTYLCNAFRQTM